MLIPYWILVVVAIIMCIVIICVVISIICNGLHLPHVIIIVMTSCILVLSVFGIISYLSTEPTDVESELLHTTNLYALGSGYGVHGTFIHGYGNVDDIQYYIGYTNTTNDGEYQQIKINAEQTILRLNDSEIPRWEKYINHHTYSSILPFLQLTADSKPYNVIYIPFDGLSNTYHVN